MVLKNRVPIRMQTHARINIVKNHKKEARVMKSGKIAGLVFALTTFAQVGVGAEIGASEMKFNASKDSVQGSFPYTPTNLSFDRGVDESGIPTGWRPIKEGYTFVLDRTEKVDGVYSARLSAQSGHDEFGALGQCIDPSDYLGSEIEFSGYIKTSNVSASGFAGLWFRVDGPGGKVLAFDNMHNRGVVGTQPWRRYRINLPVNASAVGICFGVLLVGEGTTWFDKLALNIR